MHVVVLGAGVVGVTTAYYLTERGHTVTVVDRASHPASGASGGNGGQLSWSFTDAMASPALLSKFPRIIAGLNPAFHVRPAINGQLIPWGMKFLRQCTTRQHHLNTVAVLKLAMRSSELMSELRSKTSIEFSHRRAAKLVMVDSEKTLEEARELSEVKNRNGCDTQIITPEEAMEIEPALRHMTGSYTGAVYSVSDEVGDPQLFTAGLAQWLVDHHQTEFMMDTRVKDVTASDGTLTAIETDRGTLKPDAVVVCMGAWSYRLLRRLGITTRIYPMRGYSITLPSIDTSNQVSITDLGSKTVYSRLGDQVRIAGFADFVSYRTGKDDSRVETLIQTARKTAPAIADYSAVEIEPWGGFRPMTPNSQPIVGPSAIKGIHLNTGHGMLGWTLACVTGHDAAVGV